MSHSDTLRNLMLMARADGEIATKELTLLKARRDEWNISDEEFDRLLEETESPSSPLRLPQSASARHDLLTDMALMMAVDGKFNDFEMRLLAFAAVRLEIGEEELNGILDELSDDGDELILED